MNTKEKLRALRQAMQQANIDAYLVPSTDPHMSEYVAPRWQGRSWLSGFTGSAGTLIVTHNWAGLWTDSRYFIQAERELEDSGIELMKLRVAHTPEYKNWLIDNLKPGQSLGYAGNCLSISAARDIDGKMAKNGIHTDATQDLLEDVWPDRPKSPQNPIYPQPDQYVDRSATEKIDQLRVWMEKKGLDYYLVGALDHQAWLLNVRGSDIDYNPLVVAYLGVPLKGNLEWFVGPGRLPAQWANALDLNAYPYKAAAGRLIELQSQGIQIGLDPSTTNLAIYEAAGGPAARELSSPVPGWKSIKNAEATAHIRNAMARDGLALLRLRRWLDTEAAKGKSEYEVVRQLTAYRSALPNYIGDSFGAIVGWKGNGAIVHYDPPQSASASIDGRGMLLVDSGGQYLDGTTDITRTFCLGEPTETEKRHFTLVLQGMIDLTLARFPAGTSGVQLDTLARQHLWRESLNFGHGTGHGVGYFLNVHEGPASISSNPRAKSGQHPLQAGMIFSNEPGYYLEGQYGIRCENLVQVVATSPGWLAFDTLTIFPFERKLIALDMLSHQQLQWLNDYHQQVWEAMKGLVEGDERSWLEAACQPVHTKTEQLI
ncbi:MAG: aminopeptidase P family protein [Bacteroidota bacterium]